MLAVPGCKSLSWITVLIDAGRNGGGKGLDGRESNTSTGSHMASPGTKGLGFWSLDALASAPVSKDHNRPCRSVRRDNEPELSPTGHHAHHEVNRAKMTRE